MQFQTQITVPSSFVVYLQKLLDAGVIAIDATGNVQIHKALHTKLQEAHKDLAAGDPKIAADLDVELKKAVGGGAVVTSI